MCWAISGYIERTLYQGSLADSRVRARRQRRPRPPREARRKDEGQEEAAILGRKSLHIS